MAKQKLTVNGVPIKYTPNIGFENYDLSKSGRVASGKMTYEIIAKKRKFTLAWDTMTSIELENLMKLIDTMNPFFVFGYVENNCEKTAECYHGAIKRTPYRTGCVWHWKNVTVDFIEV